MKLTLSHAIAVSILVLSFAAPLAAGPYEDAIAAYNSGDYATAFRLLRPLAEQGDGAAQYKLGFMYERGQGVTQDLVFAHMWYDISAGQHTSNAAEERDYMETLMTAVEVAKAQKLAREWKPAK
jgi:TPR repeat protein